MKKVKYFLPIFILILIISFSPSCRKAENIKGSEQEIEASGETISQLSESEMLEIGSVIGAGNLEDFKNLLTDFDINARDENGQTILMRTSSSPHTNIAEYLIENGADVNARDYKATTALMYAVNSSMVNNVEILIENSADIDAKDIEGNTPLILTASLGGHDEDFFAIYEDAVRRYEDIVELLIDSGAELNWKNDRGQNALSAARNYGLNKIANMLWEAGALEGFYWFDDINDKFEELYQQMLYDLDSVKKYMEQEGIGINTTDNYGVTPLMIASVNCRSDIIEYLIDSGADVNASDYYDFTALMFAEGANCIEIVEILINNGADVNLRAYDGRTALDSAKEAGRTEIIELLETAGAE